MHFGKGNTRFVIAFPSLGIVLKFPVIPLWYILSHTTNYIIKGNWKMLKFRFGVSIKNDNGYRHMLIAGFQANRLEYKFWRRTRHPFLRPTYFSLFGIVNIQKYGEILGPRYKKIGLVLHRLTNEKTVVPGHSFENYNNYCSNDGYIQMTDYGDSIIWPAVIKHGKEMCEVRTIDCLSERE